EALMHLAQLYNVLGRYDDSEQTYKQAIRLRPDDYEPYNALGVNYLEAGRYAVAVEAFKHAAGLKPHHVLYYSMAQAYSQMGRHEEAVEALKESIKIKPEFFLGRYELGIAYLTLGRHAEALEEFRQAVRIDPRHVDANLKLGIEYLYNGDGTGARQQYYVLKDLNAEAARTLQRLIDK
ncbi:MAG: hypothetical protein QOJ76_2522, partial [Acidobacteriota bacterium]|nr:hypothetical protein [Acidobacteriota bacterium]